MMPPKEVEAWKPAQEERRLQVQEESMIPVEEAEQW